MLRQELYCASVDHNWTTSLIRKQLNTEFLTELDTDDLICMSTDLTKEDGEKVIVYDYVNILTSELYNEYKSIIPSSLISRVSYEPVYLEIHEGFTSIVPVVIFKK